MTKYIQSSLLRQIQNFIVLEEKERCPHETRKQYDV